MTLHRARARQVVARLEEGQVTREEARRLKGFFREIGTVDVETLPFARDDTTVGCENELQAAVRGARERVDLPRTIEASSYYRNAMRRLARSSERKRRGELDAYLRDNPDGVWENSQVRVPLGALSPFARRLFEHDLSADKRSPFEGRRADSERFFVEERGETFARVPVSYLLRLTLADVLGEASAAPAAVERVGRALLDHFLNDNSSPEQISAYVAPFARALGNGAAVARENALRYLLTQLLLAYANDKLALAWNGQEALAYFAPLPPRRQRRLSECVSDNLYRELFMNPCLSGWDRGESKNDYMRLCHDVLSRSHVQALKRLQDARVVTRGLVVVPTMSNTSLANNGTHVSLGSRRLGAALAAGGASARAGEKYAGDLAIKLVEHFLPLFVNSYSGAPYRLGFEDFHPERALGFLPHELDDAHLRMLWVSWTKKARLAVFNRALTPFGPQRLDRMLARLLGRRGDFVPDYRLLDYFVGLLSTDESPALDGRPGNGDKLKRDLAEQGVFDARMTLYLPYRLREFDRMGFSGFEGRYYSVFERFDDLARAVDVQVLITALAYKYMAQGRIGHGAIPDDPFVESERRQFFFAAAIGLPFCYVRRDTRNGFLRQVLARVERARPSKYYHGYLKIPLDGYRRALLALLREDGADLVEMLGLEDTLADLELRVNDPAHAVVGRLNAAVLDTLNAASPLSVPADDYNRAAETYYREVLSRRHVLEGLAQLAHALSGSAEGPMHEELRAILGEDAPDRFIARLREELIRGGCARADLIRAVQLVLLVVAHDSGRMVQRTESYESVTSVYRAGHG